MKTAKKYKLTDETIQVDGHTLHRIEALTDFSGVHKGDKGGFVENENNLSQDGDCWVYNNAKVFSNAVVSNDALVFGFAQVYDKARVFGIAVVFNDAVVCGNAEVYGNAEVWDNARVYDNARVWGNASIYGNAKVYGDARVYGGARVYGDAKVADTSDYIVFKNWWSSGRYFTWTRSNNMWLVGCFYGTGEGLIAKAYKDSELSGREYERVVKYVESILKDNENDKR